MSNGSRAYIAVEMIAMTKRGTFANTGENVISDVQTECIVGVLALGVVSAMRTNRALPKFPVGAKTAPTKPPTLLSSPSAALHSGMYKAPAVKETPRR